MIAIISEFGVDYIFVRQRYPMNLHQLLPVVSPQQNISVAAPGEKFIL